MKQAAVSATKRFPSFPLSLATHHHVAATHIYARCAAKIGAGLMNEYLFFHAVECFALPMRVVYQIGPKQISFFLSLKLSNCKAMEKSTDLKSAHDEMHICRCCAVAGMLHSLSPTIFRGFSFFSAQKRRADSREGNPDYVHTGRKRGGGGKRIADVSLLLLRLRRRRRRLCAKGRRTSLFSKIATAAATDGRKRRRREPPPSRSQTPPFLHESPPFHFFCCCGRRPSSVLLLLAVSNP